MEGIIWKFMMYFTLKILNVTSFFSVKMGYFLTFILEFTPLPPKKPWHVIYHYIRNIKYIMNIKISFAKNDIANFDYASTLEKSFGMNFLL